MIEWHREYRQAWDNAPELYAEGGIVPWAKSKRLGLLRLDPFKAYLGVQHVDPSRPGWAIVDEPQARFFMSLFVGGRCITLRTFPTMEAALLTLAEALNVR